MYTERVDQVLTSQIPHPRRGGRTECGAHQDHHHPQSSRQNFSKARIATHYHIGTLSLFVIDPNKVYRIFHRFPTRHGTLCQTTLREKWTGILPIQSPQNGDSSGSDRVPKRMAIQIKVRQLPAQVEALLVRENASPRLKAHLSIVHEAACILTEQIRAVWPMLE